MSVATVLYQDRESEAKRAEPHGDELWLTLSELTAVSGWELKPEGVCKEEICVPVPDARRSALIRNGASGTLFNLAEFARLIEQPFATDEGNAVWYFGPAAWEWKDRLTSRQAPDFSLPDIAGHVHTLSELRGKKVFLLFWASW
jgi:AhpC/TSA family